MEAILSEYSDAYKDLYGFRPRGVNFASLEEANAALTAVYAQLAEKLESEREEQAMAAQNFEVMLSGLISKGAGDRATALRWIMEAHEVTENGELEFQYNLPYGYLS